MGMAASQVRLLQLTSRSNTIGQQLEHLSLQKTSLTREMRKVSQNYQNELSTKVFKWTNNSGVSYADLSYSNLMRPNNVNQNTPYLITDTAGRVVIDSQYEKYAQMISPDGKAGGDWASNRTEILSKLTGISAEKIESAATTTATADTLTEKVKNLQEETDKAKSAATTSYTNQNFFKNCLGNLTGVDYDGKKATNNVGDDWDVTKSHGSGHWKLGQDTTSAKAKLKSILDELKKNVKNSLTDEDYTKFEEGCDTTYETYCKLIDDGVNNKDIANVDVSTFSANNSLCMRVDNFLEALMKNYENAGGSTSTNTQGTTTYNTVDRGSDKYKAYEAKKAEFDAAKAELDEATKDKNQVLTSDEETQIKFYDQLFTAIAENGWVYNSEVSDTDYLNQMLQNNQYTITTMKQQTDDDGKSYYEYDTDIASNYDKIVSVNDSKAQNDAMAKYEAEKSRINEKESVIDTRMKNLETEQASIKEMIKGIESVRNDNTERTFSIFS